MPWGAPAGRPPLRSQPLPGGAEAQNHLFPPISSPPRPIPVENLRLLILRRLLPCRDAEPEDDVTPTPSVIGGAGQAWDSVLSSQDSASQEVLAEPPSAAEDTKPRLSREETDETGPAAEEPSSYKVVRKGRGATVRVLGQAGWGAGTGDPSPLLDLPLAGIWGLAPCLPAQALLDRSWGLVRGAEGCG